MRTQIDEGKRQVYNHARASPNAVISPRLLGPNALFPHHVQCPNAVSPYGPEPQVLAYNRLLILAWGERT